MTTHLEAQVLPNAVKGTVTPAAVLSTRVSMQTPGGGHILVAPTIYREWVSLSQSTTATGQDVQSSLGWPLQDFIVNGAEIVYFERGCIVLRPDGRCFSVHGTIYLHWRTLCDLQTNAGLNLGLPITEEEAIAGGRRSRFDNGDIYWNASSNEAFEVHGAIRDKWYALGGYTGFLGYPITDEMSVSRGGTEIGRVGQFAGGTIYWSGGTGAYETHGAIRDMYLHTYNGPVGALGFPISDETPSPGGGKRYSNFQHGCIVWTAASGALSVYTTLNLFVQNINGSGSHTFFESIGASHVWLYVNGNVTTSTGMNQNFHLPPAGGDYGNPSASPGKVLSIGNVRGDMTITLMMDGWDHCISTSDQHLGTIHATFNVDTGFGVNQPRHIDDGDFHADFDMTADSIDNPNDPNFRRAEFWGFNNFDTSQLSRAQYAETFVDVESNESGAHWFDDLYYNEFYKGIADGGNCFGMCLESIYAERNDSLFSEPIYPVPMANASNEINIKQGYQLGASYLDWFASAFLAGCFWNPIKVWQDASAAWNSGNYPVICVTDASLSAGHCLRPCGPNAFQETATQYIIEVCNPNAPGTDGTDAASRIVIDKAANTYSVALANGGPTWTGGHLSGGIISWAPFSVLCQEPRTPFWEVLGLALGIIFIGVGAGGSTTQMTDNSGNTLHKPLRAAMIGGRRWDDLETGDSTIPGLVRVPRTGSAFLSHGPILNGVLSGITTVRSEPELYRLVGLPSPFGPAPTQKTFSPIQTGAAAVAEEPRLAQSAAVANGSAAAVNRTISIGTIATSNVATTIARRSPPTSLKHEVQGTAYSWMMYSYMSAVHADISGAGGSIADELSVDKLGAIDQAFTLTAPTGASARSATVTISGRSPSTLKSSVYQIGNVTVNPGSSFVANVMPDGQTLQLQNQGSDLQLQITMTNNEGTASAAKALTLQAGKTAVVAPTDWNAINTTEVKVNILNSPGGPVQQTLTM